MSRTPTIEECIEFISRRDDILAWQTKRSFRKASPNDQSEQIKHRLINHKLYDLEKKPILKIIHKPTKKVIKEIMKELKQIRLNKDRPEPRVNNITDEQWYSPIIKAFLKKHKGKAYTYDTIAKNINYKIIDKDDKRYFLNIIEKMKSIKQGEIENIRYYYI